MIEAITNNLHMIGKKFKTDKFAHRFKGITYLQIYDLYFRYLREKTISLLELGILRGASLRMWESYFTHGRVYGLDNNPKCKQYEKGRINIEIGDQTDERIIDKLAIKARRFDIIVDDCSHIYTKTILSFKYLWKYLSPGGYYIIEDIRSIQGLKEGKKVNDIFLDIIENIDKKTDNVIFIHFWNMMCIIRKSLK